MRRREFVVAGGTAALVWPVQARPEQKVPAIGLLDLGAGSPTQNFIAILRGDLKERDTVEGRDLRLTVMDASGGSERLVAAARELIAQNPDVMVVFGDPATRALQQATTAIPIVAMVDDMLGSRFVPSLARPGGNITGLSILASELNVKRLELLHEAVPGANRIGVLADSSTTETGSRIEEAAHRLGVELVIANFASSEEGVGAAERLAASGVGAVNILATPLVARVVQAIIERLNRAGLPAIYQWSDWADLGGLLAYGPDLKACHRQVARIAERILKGAKAGDVPVEQPTKFDLAINLKTARALGLTVPPVLLARADEVIE